MPQQAVIGDVRVRSDGTPTNTSIEALTENGWIRLHGIASLSFSLKADEWEPMSFTLYPLDIELDIPGEKVALGAYKKAE